MVPRFSDVLHRGHEPGRSSRAPGQPPGLGWDAAARDRIALHQRRLQRTAAPGEEVVELIAAHVERVRAQIADHLYVRQLRH